MRTKFIAICVTGTCAVLAAVMFYGTSSTKGQNKFITEKIPPTRTEQRLIMQTLETANNLKERDVEVMVASDSRFDSELERLIGYSRPDLVEFINAAKPLSLLIVNRSSRDIVAVALKWGMKSGDRAKVFPQMQATPGRLMGMASKDPALQTRTSLVPAGGLKLVSFDNTVEQILNGLRTSYGKQRLTPGDLRKIIRGIAENRQNIESVYSNLSVSIDGLFFDDGTFVGEDTFFFFDLMRGRIDARNDFLSSLRKSSSDAGRSEILTNLVTQHQNSGPQQLRIAQNSEGAFQIGYEVESKLLRDEILRRRSHFDDQSIAFELLNNASPRKVVLRKLK